MPGIERGNVHSVEAVMRREARPGKRVLVLDDSSNWRGAGTAWHLAEKGHEVTLLTADAFVGRDLLRTSADIPLRARLKRLGAGWITDSAVTAWHGDAATIRNLLDGSEATLPFDTLLLSTVNRPDNELVGALAGAAFAIHSIGDCVAPRHAAAAIFEGRRLARQL
jgi:NADPH-dependent 2,4-dienoyl-CoA reductase/sulfur reductase-like enzyme